ncbi:centrosomal protein of 120 kDa isoform X1 [Gadus macrocephalus]|uniref:centrosomal protein of 120 kDa isoform X1 n=1 Tax=Gadus macrocephalus TaxID=80720 RepID=UPI0028CB64E7|nr:centrosomal protein of 120 kDa isoform X1 [Gadus macrocephalus]
MKTEPLLVVVSVLEGRDFPKSQRACVVVTARFDGERLSTDPVESREQPQFSTELAWELDRRTLHQHRLQRTPIKLTVFAVGSGTGGESGGDALGYVVLELRSVQEIRQEPRWYPLLSSRFSQRRPALLLSVLLENDTKTPHASPDRFRAKKAPPRPGSLAVADLVPERLEAVLVPEQGYHQVGPPELCSDMFVLSVTVAFASKLEQLVPSTVPLAAEGADFFFYYSLLGNDITSAPFLNLLSPSFQPERASVRIRSTKQVLLTYLGQQPALQVHLCCGSQSLGSAEVPLSDLSHCCGALDRQTATVEGVFVLWGGGRGPPRGPPADLQPSVGLALSLRREMLPGNSDGGDGPAQPVAPSLLARPPQTHQQGAPCPSAHTGLNRLVEGEQDQGGEVEQGQGGEGEQDQGGEVEQDQGGEGGELVSIPASSHHFCFSLDLRSLTNLLLPHTPSVVLRYWYRFLGGASPISTSPAVELRGGEEVFLPQSFCSFHFAAQPQQVQQTFTSVPLQVEVWCRAPGSRDQLVGSASVPLAPLLCAERTSFSGPLGQPACRQTLTTTAPVLSNHREKVADLCYTSTLEDQGPLQTTAALEDQGPLQTTAALEDQGPLQTPAALEDQGPLQTTSTLEDQGPLQTAPLSSAQSRLEQQDLNRTPTRAPPGGPSRTPAQAWAPGPGPSRTPAQAWAPGPGPSRTPAQAWAPGPGPSRDTLEYRTAVELELWKEEQEDAFLQQLRRKESSHMQVLAEEWRRRDGEREALVKKKEVEYNQLEERLQKTLEDLEIREKQLEHAHKESQAVGRDLRLDYELRQRELQERSGQLAREYGQQGAAERHRLGLLEAERNRLLQQVEEVELRYQALQKEFSVFREQQHCRPEARLQSEVNLLTLEKVELERKLESTTKSKLHYKQQWGRALKELARFKQREQENALHRLKRQQEELEAMRLRYLATEEKETVLSERQELDSIRHQLTRLKQQEESSDPAPSDKGEEHLARLVEERDSLLRTGVYTQDDLIISQLNTQIHTARTHGTTHTL